jgi:hypothetical protein
MAVLFLIRTGAETWSFFYHWAKRLLPDPSLHGTVPSLPRPPSTTSLAVTGPMFIRQFLVTIAQLHEVCVSNLAPYSPLTPCPGHPRAKCHSAPPTGFPRWASEVIGFDMSSRCLNLIHFGHARDVYTAFPLRLVSCKPLCVGVCTAKALRKAQRMAVANANQ